MRPDPQFDTDYCSCSCSVVAEKLCRAVAVELDGDQNK